MQLNVHTPNVISISLILLVERVTGTKISAVSDDVHEADKIKGVTAEETNKILLCDITDYENYCHPARVYPVEDIFPFFLAAFVSCCPVSFVRQRL